MKVLRDRAVDRIKPQREIGRQHPRRVPLRWVVRIRHRPLRFGILRGPLESTGGTPGQLPVVVVQVVEKSVAPLRWCAGPRAFEAAGDGLASRTAAEAVLPAETLLFEGSGLWLGPDVRRSRSRTVRFAERVAANDQRHRLGIVHRHAGERLADVARRREWIGLAVRPLGVHVDQSHLHCAEWLAELPIAAVALVSEPGVLRPPENLLGLPDVGPSETEAEGLEAHGLERHVAREDEQVRPRDLLSVLLLDRPQQAPRLIEVGVVGPTVQRRESLRPGPAAATAVRNAVRA